MTTATQNSCLGLVNYNEFKLNSVILLSIKFNSVVSAFLVLAAIGEIGHCITLNRLNIDFVTNTQANFNLR